MTVQRTFIKNTGQRQESWISKLINYVNFEINKSHPYLPPHGHVGDTGFHLHAILLNALVIFQGRGDKKSLSLDVTPTHLLAKGCSRPCQKYQHGVFPHHWFDGLITALTVLTEWKRGHGKKNVSYILSRESFDKSLMEQCEAFPGVGLGHPQSWKEAKGQKSEGRKKNQV